MATTTVTSTPVDVGDFVTLDAVARVAAGAPVVLGPAASERMDASGTALSRFIAERRRIYGVTTGYGPLA